MLPVRVGDDNEICPPPPPVLPPQVPLLVDDGSPLPESAAILCYLATKFHVADHWLPKTCLKARAHVEAALHWCGGAQCLGGLRVRAVQMEVVRQ